MRSVLFQIGPVPIRAYGLMLWIALVVGVLWTIRAARRTDIKAEHVIDVALYGLIAGVMTAHITSILLDLPYFWRNPSEIWGLWSGVLSPSGGLRGLSFHGGLVGAVGAGFLYARRKRISFLAVVDLCAPGLALGYGIGRIGCFLNGCCYGTPTSLPWAVQFHVDSLSSQLTAPSHPTQIYAMLASFVIFLALLKVEKSQRFAGHVFLSYLTMYSAYRFLIEFLRKGVTADVALAGLTQAQVVSLVLLAITVSLVSVLRRSRALSEKDRPSAEQSTAPTRESEIRDSEAPTCPN